MSGQTRKFNTKRYQELLADVPDISEMKNVNKIKVDLRGVREYARKKGIAVADLSDQEKRMFMSA
ncbi:MAG: hypothetical protein IK016_02840 [Lachnospiraceae bacterium]|nr:hypothetical protein [Lachnospiraceae bacterium]